DQPYLDIIAYLWTNSKVAFGLQCAAPVACMLIVTYALRHCRLCCNSFLRGKRVVGSAGHPCVCTELQGVRTHRGGPNGSKSPVVRGGDKPEWV
nr:transframe fusion protein [Sleeping disease virus]